MRAGNFLIIKGFLSKLVVRHIVFTVPYVDWSLSERGTSEQKCEFLAKAKAGTVRRGNVGSLGNESNKYDTKGVFNECRFQYSRYIAPAIPTARIAF